MHFGEVYRNGLHLGEGSKAVQESSGNLECLSQR